LFEKSGLSRVRFQQVSVEPRAMDFQGHTRETGPGADIQHFPFHREERGREKGIQKQLDHHFVPTLQARKIEPLIPFP
jgi:hypothetical protein